MPNRKHTKEQIAAILKEMEDGGSVLDVSKKHGLLPRTIRRWKEKYGALQDAEVKKPGSLEEENARLKKMVVNLSIENDALKNIVHRSCNVGLEAGRVKLTYLLPAPLTNRVLL